MKTHLKHIVANVESTFEEFTTVLMQIEACLNSRPLIPLSCDDDGIDVLTPGHFLIGRPLESLPDPAFSYRSVSLLRRWHLCQIWSTTSGSDGHLTTSSISENLESGITPLETPLLETWLSSRKMALFPPSGPLLKSLKFTQARMVWSI